MQLFKFIGFSAEMLNDSECIHGDLSEIQEPACEPNSCSTERKALAEEKVSW